MTFTTIMTVGGIALAGGLLETALEIMGKENHAKIIKLVLFTGVGIYSVQIIGDLLTTISRTFL